MLLSPMFEQRHLGEKAPSFRSACCPGMISTTASPLAMMNIASPASLAHRRYRHDVAITDGGERGERPPGGLRNRAELVRLHMAFDQIHAGRRERQQYQNDDKHAEQRPIFIDNTRP